MGEAIFILEYDAQKKWVKVNNNYEACISVAKTKFDIAHDITLYDVNGAEVDAEFFPIFVGLKSHQEPLHLLIRLKKTLNVFGEVRGSTELHGDASTVTLDDTLVDCNAISDGSDCTSASSCKCLTTCKPPLLPTRGTDISSEQLEELLRKKGHADILNKRNETLLSNVIRKKLVNIVANIFVERHGFDNSKHLRSQYAKAIVTLFPTLKNPYSTTGGYEQFYDPSSSSGFLAWRLRYLYQKSEERIEKKTSSHNSVRNNNKRKCTETDSDDTNTEVNNKQLKTEEVEENVLFLQNACATTQQHVIYEKTEATFEYRRTLGVISYEEFPRFFDTPGLIDLEFSLLYPKAENLRDKFSNYIDRILMIYALTENNPFAHITGSDKNLTIWNKTTRSVIAVLYMLPPTAKGRKRGCRETLRTVADRLICFKQANIPLQAVIQNRKTKQPIIVASGANVGAIDVYHVIVDDKSVKCEGDILSAIDLLFKTHFVFNLQYDEALKTFWEFIETFVYNINSDKIRYTSKMLELRTRLSALD